MTDLREREGDGLREMLRPLVAAVRPASGTHPTPEQLAAYHAGQSSDSLDDGVQEHLAACSACARVLLEMAKFSPANKPTTEITDDEIRRAWEQTRARLGFAAPTAAAPAGEVVPLSARRFHIGSFVPHLLAASLLLAAIALGAWVASLRSENQRLAAQITEQSERLASLDRQVAEQARGASETERERDDARRRSDELAAQQEQNERRRRDYEAEIAELRRPPAVRPATREEAAINVPVFELYPDETLRGADDEPKTVEIPSPSASVVFTLNSAQRDNARGSRRLEVVNDAGKIVLSRRGLRENRDGAFAVSLPRASLRPGRHRFRLYPPSGSQPEEFVISVARRP